MIEKKANTIFFAFRELLSLLWKNHSKYVWLSVVVCAVSGLASSVNVLIKQYFFEAVESASNNNLRIALGLGVFWGIFILFTLLVQGISDVMMEDLGIRLGGNLGRRVNQKAANIDTICYEDIKMLNCINKAYQGVEQSATAVRILITLCSYYIPYFLFFAVYTYFIHPVLCIGVLALLLPTLGGQYARSKYYAKFEDSVAPTRRLMNYYRRCIMDREYTKETRLLGAVYFFRTLYEAALLMFRKESWKAERRSSMVELGIRLFSLFAYIVILVIMYYCLHKGVLGTAAFVAILTSIDQTFNYMDYVGNNIGDISASIPAVVNSFFFLSLPEKSGKESAIDKHSIEFHQVSFQYPFSYEFSLKNIDLSIRQGETVAIVGANGAGKSTLAKLMLGLYLPSEGDVYIGGNNTKEVKQESISRNCSAVFQSFQKYKMNLRNNVSISCMQKEHNDTEISSILHDVDLEIDGRTFSEGLDTMLAREFGGTDISGGQWQRIAIGRGLYRNGSIIVLDEPTAAIDPIEETKIYYQFAELSKNKTAVIITHRLGSAKIADSIIVLNNGTIDDIGTHEELISRDGLYKQLYDSQAKWYQ
ncbi:ATP-binding cassette subfamily B protein [Lachnotalea glycerini]|uniref:ATP-binding cassette subfamily B protein n=1 Tax=Lachnotalea glycerini TaxID=1763509 RepID=A0A318EPH6_9FIRM|nr:ABC transporter ATP-binding protein [Lachnotalea glycerini]PXV93371.1 ATP-binding cassette subfamily B protein [Lachnotalea glycerini]